MNKPLVVRIGSKNPQKVAAVAELIKEYPHLAHAEVLGVDTPSGVSPQPTSLQETLEGAMNRARGAFDGSDYGIGIESGLMQVPFSKSGYMDVCACAIYDGDEFHLGLSSAWEFPDPAIMKLMVKKGMEMNEAVHTAGMTKNTAVGSAEGAIGILTKGRIDRREYSKQALRMALIHLEHFDF